MPKKKPVMIRWHFPDGDMLISIEEQEACLAIQAARALASDDPETRAVGHKLITQQAARSAAYKQAAIEMSVTNARNARRPRRKRGKTPHTALIERGLGRLLLDHPSIKPGELCEMLAADGRINYDDDDLELVRDGDYVVVRDLADAAEIQAAPIKKTSLGAYLSNARKT